MKPGRVLITGKNSKMGDAFEEFLREKGIDYICGRVSLRDDSYKDDDWSGYDVILHVAGITKTDTGPLSPEEEDEYYRVNRDLTRQVAKKAKDEGVRHFIYLSTMMVYGNSAPVGHDRIITSDTVPNPECIYGKSKLQGETILEMASDDFKVLVVREPVVYGEHFYGEFDSLSRIARRIGIFPQINSCKSFIYEGNLCELLRLAMEKELSGVICPQNREMITTSQIYSEMRSSYGKKCHLIRGLGGLLRIVAGISEKTDILFASLRYSEELSSTPGIDYQIFSLRESLLRINEYRKNHSKHSISV